jgi:hypothetical protein
MRTNPRIPLVLLTAVMFAGSPAFARIDCNEGLQPLDSTAESRLTAQDFISEVAAKEKTLPKVLASYGFRLEVLIQTLKDGQVDGEFRQVSLSTVDEKDGRRDTVEGTTTNTLTRVKFAEKDVGAFRDALPFMLTPDKLADRDIVYAGRQGIGDFRAHVFDVLPRDGQDRERAFVGRTWVRGRALAIVRTCGRSPGFPIARMRFEGIRSQVAGSDDYLPTSIRADEEITIDSDKVHVRLSVKYSDYKLKP